MSYKLAGVTFESRQALLENIYKHNNRFIKCLLNRTTYNGEPAIQVIEQNSALQIGWIAKVDVPKLYNLPCNLIHGEIGKYMDTWFCELYSPIMDKRKNKPFCSSR